MMNENISHICLTRSVKSLPSHWYYDKTHYEKELETVWHNNWIYVCSESALKENLSYKTVQIGNHNIIVLRDKENNLKAYHNTCRHRGTKLSSESDGKLKSNVLVCPYHQWSYSASSGELKAITSIMEPENFNKCDHGLFKIQLKAWQGLIFINFNAEKQWAREDVFQQFEDILAEVPIDKMVLGHTWRKEVKCNWKMYWENYSECLHCPNVHPELSQLVPLYSRRLNSIKEAPDWQEKLSSDHPKYRGGLREGAQTWSTDGSAQGHVIKSIEGHDDLFKGHSYSTTWPTMFVGVYIDHVRLVRMLPIDHESTELVVEWLFEASALNDEKYHKENVTEFAIRVMEEDAQVSELNQQGVHSSAFTEGVLMPEEHTIKEFHDWLKKELD